MTKRKVLEKFFLPKIRLVEAGTLEELELIVNQGVECGYKVEALEHHRNEFFQSHSAVLVRSKSAWLIPKTKSGGKK